MRLLVLMLLIGVSVCAPTDNRTTKSSDEGNILGDEEETPNDEDCGDDEDDEADEEDPDDEVHNFIIYIPKQLASLLTSKQNNPIDDDDGTEDNDSDEPESLPTTQNKTTKSQGEQSNVPRKKDNNNDTTTPNVTDDSDNRNTPITPTTGYYDRKNTASPNLTNDCNGNSNTLPLPLTKVSDKNLNLSDNPTSTHNVPTEPQVIKIIPNIQTTPVGGKPIQDGINPSANTPASSRKSTGLKGIIEALTNSLKNPEYRLVNSVLPVIQRNNKPILNDNEERFESLNSNQKQSGSETSRLHHVQSNWSENKPERDGNTEQLGGSLMWVPSGGTSELGPEPFNWGIHNPKGVNGIPAQSPIRSGISGFSDTNRRPLERINWSERNPTSGVVKQSRVPIILSKNNPSTTSNWAANIPEGGNSGSFEGPINWNYPISENNGQLGETLNWSGHNTGGNVRLAKEPLNWNGNNPSGGSVWGENIPTSGNSGQLREELNWGSHSPGRTREQSRGPLNWNGNNPTGSLSEQLGGLSNWNHDNHASKNVLSNGKSILGGNLNTRGNNGLSNGLLNWRSNKQNGGLNEGIIGGPHNGLETSSVLRN